MKYFSPGVLFAACATLGVGFATASAIADEDPPCIQPEILFIEDWGAQDTDLDGIATVLEGDFDLNSDGQYTEVEAIAQNVCRYIAWGTTQVSGPVEQTPFYCLVSSPYPSRQQYVGTCLSDSRYVCVDDTGDGVCDRTRRKP